jgi:hypothetical protein
MPTAKLLPLPGSTNDQPRIQEAIDLMIGSGGTVHLDEGTYVLDGPLVLPRTTINGRDPVRLCGAGVGATIVSGGSGFPSGRALIEWEGRVGATLSSPGARWRAWNQRIEHMTLRPAAVDGCRAIHYLCEDRGEPVLERWHGEIANLSIESSNAYHPECIFLEGNVALSTFSSIWNDVARGNPVETSQYATLCLRFDEGDASTHHTFFDRLGCHWSRLDNIHSTIIRGGWSGVLRGRFNGCTASSLMGGVGSHDGTPQYDIRHSINSTFSGLFSEGRLDAPQYRLTNCHSVVLEGVTIGTPTRNSVPPPFDSNPLGNGVELISCTKVRIAGGWQTTSSPSFTWLNYPTEPKDAVIRVLLSEETRLCDVEVDIGNVDTHDQVIVEVGDPRGRKNRSRSLRRYDNRIVEKYDGVVAIGSNKPPRSLAELNAIFSPWLATFSHAWNFEQTAGAEPDYATSSGIDLTPINSPVQGVSTGLPGGDLGVQFSDGANAGMRAGSASDLQVTTGSVVMVGTVRLLAAPAATRNVVGKRQSSTRYYYVGTTATSGQLRFATTDGSTTLTQIVSGNHAGPGYVDFLAVLDRDSATHLMSLTTSVGDSGAVDASALGDISSTALFHVGSDPSIHLSPDLIVTFVAWGTVPGTLVANRISALATWRAARGG